MEALLLEFTWLIFVTKIILAIVCGYVLGIERETMGKPAGIKTHTLICMGSCIFTHFSLLTTTGDPTRIAAQVVSGIGFIGAGTIMQSKHKIEGLTSAALVFVNAAIGMLIGGNYFVYSITATIILLILFKLIRSNKLQVKLVPYRIYITCKNYDDVKKTIEHMTRLDCKITNKKIEKKTSVLELSVSYLSTPLSNHRILSKLYQSRSLLQFTQI